MRVIRDGLHRPRKQRNAVRWTLAISALALAFPASAFGAQKGPHANATSANPGPSRDAGLGRTVLALGIGYSTPDGSPQVRYLQRRLELAGYFPGVIDGLYGPRTQQAVVAFQTSHGLGVDGIVGPHTWAVLSSQVLTLGPGAGNQPGGSNIVRSLQRRLAAVGDSPGPIDGRYGVLTEGAVMRFQRAHGLQVTGVAGPRALTLLTTAASPAGRSEPVSRTPASPLPQSSSGARPPAINPAPRTIHRVAPAARPVAPAVHPVAPAVHPTAPAVHPAPSIAPKAPGGSDHRRGAGTPSWMTFVAVPVLILAIALLVMGLRYARRRDSVVTRVATTSRGKPRQPAREQTVLTKANGYDGAVARNTHGNQIHTNGHRAGASWGHGGHGAENRPSRRDEADLFASAEAAAAFNLGLLLEAQGRKVEARAAYGRADERGHGTAASNLGRLLEEQGGLAEAEAAYRRADERGDAAGAFNLGLLLEARGGMVEAWAAYGRADERGHGTAASNLGRLLEEQGGLAEAEAAYRRADERGNAVGAIHLGVLLQKRGSLHAAAAAFGRASDRGNNAAASYLGVLLKEQGAEAEAEAAFRRADERGDAIAAFNLGVVLEARGALRDAEQAYRRATERGEGAVADRARAALLDLHRRLDEADAARVRRADAA